ncbi:MAG: WbuC family cupin fold metalloprotein [SAR86 cluster bacterium]|jgi:cupin fold WbuC family metalloprotein|nr:WbuC family cupin fold metalloprotein [SAR86 cluster bacterium]|tara:strand:+ start:1324 stop:1848 length:525 start_codon:yes stop_codon:yes gene_type:complete
MKQIRLDNDSLREDSKAKSTSFFVKNEPNFFSNELISDIIEIGRNRKTNSRVCMHPSSDSKMHEMLIYQTQENFFPPKKQLTIEKSFLVMQGEIALCIFEETGQLKDYVILGNSSNLFCRIPPGIIHMDLTMSEFSVHLESVPGPYKKEDCLFPDWYDEKSRVDFLSTLKSKLK